MASKLPPVFKLPPAPCHPLFCGSPRGVLCGEHTHSVHGAFSYGLGPLRGEAVICNAAFVSSHVWTGGTT